MPRQGERAAAYAQLAPLDGWWSEGFDTDGLQDDKILLVDFVAVVDQVITILRQRDRLIYRTLKRQWERDDEALEELQEARIYGQRLMADEEERASGCLTKHRTMVG